MFKRERQCRCGRKRKIGATNTSDKRRKTVANGSRLMFQGGGNPLHTEAAEVIKGEAK